MNLYKYYYSLLPIKIHYLYGALFFFLFSLTAIWWFFLYQPLTSSIQRIQQTFPVYFEQIKAHRLLKKEVSSLANNLKMLQEKAALYTNKQLCNNKIQEAIAALTEASRKHEVIISTFKTNVHSSALLNAEIFFEAKATLDHTISFFNTLEKCSLLVCNDCNVINNNDAQLTIMATFIIC